MAWVFNPFTGTFDYSIVAAGGVLPPSGGGTGTSTVFTTGSVVFAGASGVYTQDNANFFWDNTNDRLGIGTATPPHKLSVIGNTPFFWFENSAASVFGLKFAYATVERASVTFYPALAQMQFTSGYAGYGGYFTFTNNGVTSMTINDAGNVGIGVVPSPWFASDKALQISTFASLSQNSVGATCLGFNMYQNAAGNYIYTLSTSAARYDCGAGGTGTHGWFVAASGTGGNTISFSQAMTLGNDGVLTVAAATATPAGGSVAARLIFGTTAGFGIYYGSGAPTVSAAKGSLYLRSDGTTTNDRMYVNTNGTTTWTAVTTVA